MTISGGSRRSLRSSAAEGPSIYKCDQLRQMLEAALQNRSKFRPNMDVVKFLEQYLPVRQETTGRGKAGSYAVGTRLHAFCRQLSEALGLNKDFVQERIIHGFVHDESQLKELCDQLSVVREHYEMALSLLKDEPSHRPVTIRIGTTNLINMRVLPSVLEAARQKFQAQFPEVRLRFVQTIMDSEDLLFGSQPAAGLDAIVACCLDGRADKIAQEELVARLPLRCCLLRQRDIIAGGASASIALPNWEAIRDTPMVALASRRKHFDVPWPQIEGLVEYYDEVPTLLEAHARVAASDGWTLSYRELLDDADERNLEALDLPDDPLRDATLIVAVLPRRSKRSRSQPASGNVNTTSNSKSVFALSGDSKEKQAALAILEACLCEAFEERKALKQEAEWLTQCLSRFTHTYHVSEFAPTKDYPYERLWFSGRLQLECTANGNLSGSVTIGNPAGEPMRIRVFGRPLKFHEGKIWNLNWRSSDLREESGTTNLFVSKADLESGEALVGHWVGRSSWTDGDVRPTGGPVILHSRSGLTARELRALVMKYKDSAIPNLQLVGDRVVPHADGKFAALPDSSSIPKTRDVTPPTKKAPRPR